MKEIRNCRPLGLGFRECRVTRPQIVLIHVVEPATGEVEEAAENRRRLVGASVMLACCSPACDVAVPLPGDLRTVYESTVGRATARLLKVTLQITLSGVQTT